jgi:hypothetical protein
MMKLYAWERCIAKLNSDKASQLFGEEEEEGE